MARSTLHTGAGNLGTYSYAGTVRVVPEMLDAAWENCVIHRGDTRNGTPWTLGQFGSNTIIHRDPRQLRRGDGHKAEAA